MPFNARKRYSKFQSLPAYKKVLSVASTARTALSIATSLAALINTEFKFIDHTIAAAAIATPATTLFIHGLAQNAQGTDEQLRIGNSILPKSLMIKLRFSGNTSGGVSQEIRYMIIIDRDQDGTPPTIVNLLQLTTLVDSPINMDNRKRFRILFDGKLDVGNGGATANMVREKNRSHYFRFNKPQRTHMHKRKKWYHILYSNTSAANASMDNGQIYILAWSNEVTNSPTCRSFSRLRFIDN